MRLKPFLCCSSLLVLLALPAVAEPLAPRGEVSVKGGTDRSLLTTEFWAPLAQQSDRVLYGDVRLMGDNDENREGNLGLGYRQIKNDSVVGVHGWIDRRRTQHNSTFHQLTFGVERLGHTVDARANVYIPINNGRNITTRNIGLTSPYLAGSGIYYDTNGSISETPQYGVDGELGYRLPILQKQADAIRVYGGGYYFFRDNTIEVPGIRFRTEAQINKAVSIGARVQYDKPRGTQGFLEATLKFPFNAKRLYQESGIRSRLDESPERDVDIVTDSKIDTGLFKPVLNTTGTAQRILYVDNSKADGGDGSYERPFNTLKSAEAALQANDILYINRGDGTTRNMNQGITIDKANIQLIGSGSALSYGGYNLLNAGSAPVITNTAGHGIYVQSVENLISGITVSGSTDSGIYIDASKGNRINAVTLDKVTSTLNKRGIDIASNNGTDITKISISNSNITQNSINGVSISIAGDGDADEIYANGNNFNNNTMHGFFTQATGGGHINKITLSNNNANANLQNGIFAYAVSGNSTIDKVSMENNNASSNTQRGVYVYASNGGQIRQVETHRLTTNDNIQDGFTIQSNGATSSISSVDVRDVTSNRNRHGGFIYSNNNGSIGTVTTNNVTALNNTQYGLLYQGNSGSITRITANNITANNNAYEGVRIEASTTGTTIGQVSLAGLSGNGNRGGFIIIAYNSATINNIALSNMTLNNNTQHGLQLYSYSSGVIQNVTANAITANGNTQQGVYLLNSSSGVIDNVSLSDIKASSNLQNGIYVSQGSTGGAIDNIKISNSDTLTNAVNGIYLQKANAAASFNVDLGGGAFGGIGQNRSFGNTGKDLRLNYTGGGAVFAKNNWWGNATGLQAGRVTLSASTTVDSTAFLTADPRP